MSSTDFNFSPNPTIPVVSILAFIILKVKSGARTLMMFITRKKAKVPGIRRTTQRICRHLYGAPVRSLNMLSSEWPSRSSSFLDQWCFLSDCCVQCSRRLPLIRQYKHYIISNKTTISWHRSGVKIITTVAHFPITTLSIKLISTTHPKKNCCYLLCRVQCSAYSS